MIFSGSLNANEIFAALYNMIISQQVFADPISDETYSEIVEMCRVDGSLYGDQKLYYSTDVLKTHKWGNDAEAQNLLSLDRPDAPACQAIVLDQFRQIRLTVDNYLTKRAWGTEGAFASFNSVMLSWLRNTKKVYDVLLLNSFVGTDSSSTGSQTQSITYTLQDYHYFDGTDADGTDTDALATEKLKVLAIAKKVADIIVEMKDITRDYNDNGFLRAYGIKNFVIIWNAEIYNEMTKIGMPNIFHKDGLLEHTRNIILPSRFFGAPTSADISAANNDGTYRSLIECDYSTDGTTSGTVKHVLPGDLIPLGYIKIAETGETTSSSKAILAGQAYDPDSTIICKIIHKDSVPYMSAFETETNFFNPRSLTENHYLTFGHNTLEHLKEYPFVTLSGVNPS